MLKNSTYKDDNEVIHRGELLRVLIDKYCDLHKTSITSICHKANKDQSTIYRHFAKPDLAFHILMMWGKIIQHDFSLEFPELISEFNNESMVNEPPAEYSISTISDCLKLKDYYQNKYILLLEKHNELLLSKLSELSAT